jgi:hypothetical protein
MSCFAVIVNIIAVSPLKLVPLHPHNASTQLPSSRTEPVFHWVRYQPHGTSMRPTNYLICVYEACEDD